MSMNTYNYVIAGYDLTKYKSKLYTKDWLEDENKLEKWTCNQVKGNIQLFTDFSNNFHLYFGYILSDSDLYEIDNVFVKFSISDLETIKKNVDSELHKVFPNMPREPIPYEVICFSEIM